jgi:colicin import membrane protein
MKKGLTISGAGHAAILLWSVLTFAGTRLPDHTDALPVDVISTSDFSQLTNGAKTAPKAEQPKPVAEKIAPPTPVDDPTAAPAKKEVKAAAEVPPTPAAKPPEPKAAKKPASPPIDPIAEAIKKNDDKRPDPKPEAKTQPKKPAPAEPEFNPRNIAQLLDKRTPTRIAAAGSEINDKVTQGVAGGTASQMSLYELDALRARLSQLWNPPAGARELHDLSVTIRVKFRQDGSVDGRPRIMSSGGGPLYTAASESAVRAILAGQPFTMLKPEHYDQWNEIDITFDQNMMLGG